MKHLWSGRVGFKFSVPIHVPFKEGKVKASWRIFTLWTGPLRSPCTCRFAEERHRQKILAVGHWAPACGCDGTSTRTRT